MTHNEIILDLLDDGAWHSNFEIHEKTNILRYSARILDLRRKGYLIEAKDDEFDRRKYWYRLLKTNLNGVTIQNERTEIRKENKSLDLVLR